MSFRVGLDVVLLLYVFRSFLSLFVVVGSVISIVVYCSHVFVYELF